MKGEPFLGLTAKVYNTSGVELQAEHCLVTAPESCLGKGLKQAIEKKEVLILGIIGNNY